MIPSAVFILAIALQNKISLQQIFEKSWEYAKNLYTCFDDLERAYDRVETSWKALGSVAGVRCWRPLLLAIKSLYSCSDVCVRVGRIESRRSPWCFDSDKGVCCHRFFSQSTSGVAKLRPTAASGLPTSLIRPVKYLSHFFQVQRFRLCTAVQQH